MRILFFFDQPICPNSGGTERSTYLVATALSEKGYDVCFLSPISLSREIPSDGKYFFLPDRQELKGEANKSYVEELIRQQQIDWIVNAAANGSWIYFFSKKLFPQVKIASWLHFSVYEGLNYFRELLPLRFSISDPVAFCFSCYRLMFSPFYRKRAFENKKKRFRYLHDYSDKVIVLSDVYKSDFIHLIGEKDSSKIVVIPNPFSFDRSRAMHMDRKEKIVLFVGRLSFQEKRLDRLIRVWKRLEPSFPDWKLLIVGDGDDRSRLEQLVKRLQLNRISFEGKQDPFPYYEKASIFAMTSTHEGQPMVLIEAMECEVVPILFDSFGAATEMIEDGRSGFLVSPFDERMYADRLSNLMQDELLRKAMALCGRELMLKNYRVDSLVQKWKLFVNNEK